MIQLKTRQSRLAFIALSSLILLGCASQPQQQPPAPTAPSPSTAPQPPSLPQQSAEQNAPASKPQNPEPGGRPPPPANGNSKQAKPASTPSQSSEAAQPQPPKTISGTQRASSQGSSANDQDTQSDSGRSDTRTYPSAEVGSPQTAAEREAEWDQQFDVALGVFDERLAREQIELEKQRRENEQGRGAGEKSDEQGDGQGSYGAPAPPSDLPFGEAEGEEGGGGFPPIASTGGRGAPSPGKKYEPPADIPDGKNDDVVARQLREAAERESDPELRKKLWEEYRKYKAGGN